MGTKRLKENFNKQKRIFWCIYLGTAVGILILSMVITVYITSWQAMMQDFAEMKVKDWLFFLVGIFCYSVPFRIFYWFMRTSQKECMAHYEKMSEQERITVSRIFDRNLWVGNMIMMENYFVFRNIRRFFFRNILSYREVVWVYITRQNAQYTDMDNMLFSPQMQFFSLVFVTRDRKKHTMFLGTSQSGDVWTKLRNRLPANVVYGYGREQKQQAKETMMRYAEFDPSILAKRRIGRWRFAGFVMSFALIIVSFAGAFKFLESDYYDYLKRMHKADEAYAAGDYTDAHYYYKWAQRLNPDSKRAQEGIFLSFLEITRDRSDYGDTPDEIEQCYQLLLEWHPEMGELYEEAAEAELACQDPMRAISFLDMGIAAQEDGILTDPEIGEDFQSKREYILSHIWLESCTVYRDGKKSSEVFYNKAGDITENTYFYGTVSYRTEYVYDDNGRLVEENDYDRNGNNSGTVFYIYDAKGNRVKEDRYEGVVILRHSVVQYDSSGNLILYQLFIDEELVEWQTWEYDENGNTVRDQRYEKGILSLVEAEYDHAGNETVKCYYDQDGKLYKKTEKFYRDLGTDGTEEETITYNGLGQEETRIKTRRDADGNTLLVEDWSYSEEGQQPRVSSYEYDAAGNEIKKTTTFNETTTIISRIYHYQYEEE